MQPTFDRKWSTYALAGSAFLSMAGTATAAPIITNVNQTISVPDGSQQVQNYELDLNNDNTIEFLLSAFTNIVSEWEYGRGVSITAMQNGAEWVYGNANALYINGYPIPLAGGTMIDGSLAFATNGKSPKYLLSDTNGSLKGSWPNDLQQSRYLGLRFLIGQSTHYGWAEVSTQLGSADMTIVRYAYESEAGVGIQVPSGDVPEPSTMALFALGAAGVMALKRKRKA